MIVFSGQRERLFPLLVMGLMLCSVSNHLLAYSTHVYVGNIGTYVLESRGGRAMK